MKVNTNFEPGRENTFPGGGVSSKNRPQFDEADDLFDLCKDIAFKAVFTKSTPASQAALSNLVSALIGHDVSITTINANEPPVDNIWERQIRFDIRCKAVTGELVNVEMSLTPNSFEPSRFEYYAGRLFTSQKIRGVKRAYDELKPAYQITIMANERFFDDEVILHKFEYYDPLHGVPLNGKSRIITLELPKLDRIIEKSTEAMNTTERWGSFLRYLTDKAKREKINEIIACEEGIAMACEVMMTISKDEIEWARQESKLKYELDLQDMLVHAERKGERKVLDLLKSGKPPEEILREYDGQ